MGGGLVHQDSVVCEFAFGVWGLRGFMPVSLKIIRLWASALTGSDLQPHRQHNSNKQTLRDVR